MNKVVINGKFLSHKRGGLNRYATSVVRELLSDQFFEYIVAEPSAKFCVRPLWENSTLPTFVRQKKAEILYSPELAIPLFFLPPRVKVVVTIHDLRWIQLPQSGSLSANQYLNVLFRRAVHRADAIIVVSNFTRDTVLEYYPSLKRKLAVIYPFVDRKSFNEVSLTREPVILYVGAIAAHKNVYGLLKAFRKVVKVIPHKLVLVGNKVRGLRCEVEFERLLADLPSDRFSFHSGLSDEKIIELYRTSDFFVFPSFYEGFGFPPLEAMACGCPVLCSNACSLPEICGDAVLYCNPFDPDDIADKMVLMAKDRGLKDDLVSRGRDRVNKFNRLETVSGITNLFKRVMSCDGLSNV